MDTMEDKQETYGDVQDASDAQAEPVTQELRLIIDNSQVGGIIGKKGANVMRVREEAGVFLSILKAETNVQERVMVLKGQYDQLVKGILMICNLLVEAASTSESGGDNDGLTKLKLLVHRHAVGAVIGKGGSTIKETQAQTGARVQVSNDPLPQSTEKSVTISGTPEAIHAATSRVLACLRDNPLRPGTKSYPYVPGLAAFPMPTPFMAQGFGYPGMAGMMAPNMQQSAMQSGAFGQDFAGAPANVNTQKIAIPTICTGCIIGKGGAVIRDLRAQSGTNISIADAEAANPDERVVTLTGTAHGIQAAIFLIRQLVEQYQPAAAQ